MTNKHYRALEVAIQQWTDEQCKDAGWPNVIVGNKTVELMAAAARAVFDACEESQAFAVAEGYYQLPEMIKASYRK